MDSHREYAFVDLFSGAGGFTEGLLLAGNETRSFRLLAASDIHANACLTHTNRFQRQLGLSYSFIQEDIRSKLFADILQQAVAKHSPESGVDVVVGGPPCQGFSVFGKRNENDPRNDLFLHYLAAIQAITPKYFVMENVPGLAQMYGGKAVRSIYDRVSRMGPVKYELVGPITVNAADFGVPQARERILFIGCRQDMQLVESIRPTGNGKKVSVRDAIGDLEFLRPWESCSEYHPGHPAQTAYQRDSRRGRLFLKSGIKRANGNLQGHEAARHSPEVIARFSMIEVGRGLESIPAELWEAHLKSSKKWCVKLHPDNPAYTVVTLPDDFVHYSRNRVLTVRELARLQSFDDTFEFLGPRSSGGGGKGNKKRTFELPQYSQVGNAVPPLLARGIGQAILQALDANSRTEATNEVPNGVYRGLLFRT